MTGASRTPEHFCPGCGKQLNYGPRNPWRFCGPCVSKATDAEGHAIRFIGMGAEWCYAEGHGPDAHDPRAVGVICLIAGRPVIVHEARQGGQVAEPIYPDHLSTMKYSGGNRLKNIVDLTDRRTLAEVIAERLTAPGRMVRS